MDLLLFLQSDMQFCGSAPWFSRILPLPAATVVPLPRHLSVSPFVSRPSGFCPHRPRLAETATQCVRGSRHQQGWRCPPQRGSSRDPVCVPWKQQHWTCLHDTLVCFQCNTCLRHRQQEQQKQTQLMVCVRSLTRVSTLSKMCTMVAGRADVRGAAHCVAVHRARAPHRASIASSTLLPCVRVMHTMPLSPPTSAGRATARPRTSSPSLCVSAHSNAATLTPAARACVRCTASTSLWTHHGASQCRLHSRRMCTTALSSDRAAPR